MYLIYFQRFNKKFYSRIQNKDFIYYRDQIVELFPTEIGELKNEREECIGAKGRLLQLL